MGQEATEPSSDKRKSLIFTIFQNSLPPRISSDSVYFFSWISMYMKMKTKQRYLDGVFIHHVENNTFGVWTHIIFNPPKRGFRIHCIWCDDSKKRERKCSVLFHSYLNVFFVLETWFLSRIQCSKIYKNSKLWDREHPQRLRINFFYSTGTDLKLNMQEIFFKKNFPCF